MRYNCSFLRGGFIPEMLSKQTLEPDPVSTGVGIGTLNISFLAIYQNNRVFIIYGDSHELK